MISDLPGGPKEQERLACDELENRQASALLLQHRIKNMLANIRALAAQTYCNSDTLDEFYEAFEGRLQALALAQGMLGARKDGMVNLTDLVLEQLLSDAAAHPDAVSTDGPDVLLEPDAAQTFALVIHELITNAIKHGALGSEDGRISVRWGIHEREPQPYFQFDWRETGVSIAPDGGNPGFGRRLIEEAVPHQLGGEAKLLLPPDGCRLHMSVPVGQKIRLVTSLTGGREESRGAFATAPGQKERDEC
ncbi:two-component sensor histidine kinase [Dichotomicrobium thermohalophilum]|uniref:histidine kinase n=2 Tax=Dichotomicrobium thermohalophilum TaxID=933063 RepID=A0A397PPL2_9HYPH|nr:two-component sensor histidine kinase [Dichotomicrobium thermohalophilum]